MKKDNHGQYFSSEHDCPRPRVLTGWIGFGKWDLNKSF